VATRSCHPPFYPGWLTPFYLAIGHQRLAIEFSCLDDHMGWGGTPSITMDEDCEVFARRDLVCTCKWRSQSRGGNDNRLFSCITIVDYLDQQPNSHICNSSSYCVPHRMNENESSTRGLDTTHPMAHIPPAGCSNGWESWPSSCCSRIWCSHNPSDLQREDSTHSNVLVCVLLLTSRWHGSDCCIAVIIFIVAFPFFS